MSEDRREGPLGRLPAGDRDTRDHIREEGPLDESPARRVIGVAEQGIAPQTDHARRRKRDEDVNGVHQCLSRAAGRSPDLVPGGRAGSLRSGDLMDNVKYDGDALVAQRSPCTITASVLTTGRPCSEESIQ